MATRKLTKAMTGLLAALASGDELYINRFSVEFTRRHDGAWCGHVLPGTARGLLARGLIVRADRAGQDGRYVVFALTAAGRAALPAPISAEPVADLRYTAPAVPVVSDALLDAVRALDSDPYNASALRVVGHALLREADAARAIVAAVNQADARASA